MYFSVPLKKEWTKLCSKHLQKQSLDEEFAQYVLKMSCYSEGVESVGTKTHCVFSLPALTSLSIIWKPLLEPITTLSFH